MSEEIFQTIVLLITEKMGKYRKPLQRDTRLERDLGISGDDAVELLEAFAGKLNVDISEFQFNHFFTPEGDSLLATILGSSKRKPEVDLTIGDLENAAIKGKLTIR